MAFEDVVLLFVQQQCHCPAKGTLHKQQGDADWVAEEAAGMRPGPDTHFVS